MSAHAPEAGHGAEAAHGHAEAGHETAKKSIVDRIGSWVRGMVKWAIALPAAAVGAVTGAIEGATSKLDNWVSSGADDFNYALA